jgi:phosphotransferase system enzyme I (PtsP)
MQHIELMYDISHEIMEAETHSEALSRIATKLKDFLEADVCSFYLLQKNSDDTLVLAATDGLHEKAVGNIQIKVGEGLTGHTFSIDEFYYVNDATNHEKFKYIPGIGEEPFKTFIGVPLKTKNKKFGVLVFQFVQQKNYSPLLEKLLVTIASLVSNMIMQFDILEIEEKAEETMNLKDYIVKGIGLSEGFAIGSPVHIIYEYVEVMGEKFDKNRELRLMRSAFNATIKELKRLIRNLEKKSGSTNADIFHAHLLMLKDGSFKNDIQHHIVHYKKSAAFSIRHVADRFIERFRSMNDPYLKERAADIEDICQRLLHNLGAVRKKVNLKKDSIIISKQLTPGETASLDLDKVCGFVSEKDGPTSHTAILARSRGIPAVGGIKDLLTVTEFADKLIIDGNKGIVIINPSEKTIKKYKMKIKKMKVLAEEKLKPCEKIKTEGIKIYANVSSILDAKKADELGAEGIGLVRTEIFYLQEHGSFDLRKQHSIYSSIFNLFKYGNIVVRLLDIGADKVLNQYAEEENPALGLRGARLLLSRQRLLKTQIRALIRLNRSERLKILIPFVANKGEFYELKKVIKNEFEKFNIKVPDIGLMIEIPSIVFELDELIDKADFFSIGTNDLFQYFCAVDRNNPKVAKYYKPMSKHFINLLKIIYDKVSASGKHIEICGEIASEKKMINELLKIGYKNFSVNPYSLNRTINSVCEILEMSGN